MVGPLIWSSTSWYSAEGAPWWGINLKGCIDYNWLLALECQRSGGCGHDDAPRSGAMSARLANSCFPDSHMSARPTLLGVPDELFIKILSSLDFLQLVRSQLVRDFCHSPAIRCGL